MELKTKRNCTLALLTLDLLIHQLHYLPKSDSYINFKLASGEVATVGPR